MGLDLNPSWVTFQLCDIGQVTYPFRASVSQSVTGDHNSAAFTGLFWGFNQFVQLVNIHNRLVFCLALCKCWLTKYITYLNDG